jgi:hypothetical protein
MSAAASCALNYTSVCGLKLLVYEALSFSCMRPSATEYLLEFASDVRGCIVRLKLLVYEALSY